MTSQSNIIKFYKNIYQANGKDGYLFNEIINWDDIKLEKEHDFIQWLFPLEKKGMNAKSEILTEKDIEIFKKNIDIRENVKNATHRMINFYGYKVELTKKDKIIIQRVKDLYRKKNNTVIGLYSSHNYLRLTRMMTFLNKINMKILSSCIFMFLKMAMEEDAELKKRFLSTSEGKSSYDFWLDTQKEVFLRDDSDTDSDTEIENSDEEIENSDDEEIEKIYLMPIPEDSKIKQEITYKNEKRYQLRGLENINNSCYLDCILMPLLYKRNKYIEDNLFRANIESTVKNTDKSEFVIKTKKLILQEIINIAKKIRCKSTQEEKMKIFNCKKFRLLISFCKIPNYEDFSSSQTQDSAEFLLYIFELFNIEKGIDETLSISYKKDEKDIYYTNKSVQTRKQNCIVTIDHSLLKTNKNLSYFLKYKTIVNLQDPYIIEGEKYFIKKEKSIKKITSDFLIFNIQRLYFNVKNGKQIRDESSISIEETISSNEQIFELSSIVVHTRNHYQCFLKANDWILYNDIDMYLFTNIGSFSNVKEHALNPSKYGTIFFYTKK
jgi:hypothetical protein